MGLQSFGWEEFDGHFSIPQLMGEDAERLPSGAGEGLYLESRFMHSGVSLVDSQPDVVCWLSQLHICSCT